MKLLKRFVKALSIQNYKNFFELFHFIRNYIQFKKLSLLAGKRFSLKIKDVYPRLEDRRKSHEFDAHYIYHPAWASRIIVKNKPAKHIDISSSLYFVTIASSFIPIEFYDYRPAQIELSNLKTYHGDLNNLPFETSSVHSLSCMHVVEHIGLGRYGDVLDYDGDIKAICELKRVVAVEGDFLFVVPIGEPRIEYNAHRIYSYKQVLNFFEDFSLQNFSFVTDKGVFIENCEPHITIDQSYGCGCFWFKKIK